MSVIDAMHEINNAPLEPKTRSNALALLALAHEDNGYLCLDWQELGQLFGASPGAIRRHLGYLRSANILYYGSNGDGLVYMAFKAWTRVGARKTTSFSTKIDEPVVENRAWTRDGQPPDSPVNDGARADARKTTSFSTKIDEPVVENRASPHTRELVGWLDGSSDPTIENQPTNPPPPAAQPEPTDAALSAALLAAVRVIPAKIPGLVAAHPFEHVRDAVAEWWMGRQSVGGPYENAPGVVVYWLENWQRSSVPPISDAFRHTDLYRQFRTAAELAADAAVEEDAEAPRAPPALPEPGPGHYLDDPAWRQVAAAGDHVVDKIAGVVEVGQVDGVPLYRLACRDARDAQWMARQGAAALRRRLSVAAGLPVLVEIIQEE